MPSNVITPPSIKNKACRLKTRIGIIADKVGSGKSNVVLSLIASDPDPPTQPVATFDQMYTYGMNSVSLTVTQEKRMCNLNIIVIPHNLVSQWTSYVKDFFNPQIQHTIISKSKHIENLRIDTICANRLIIITTTFYPLLVTIMRPSEIQIKRVIFDEVDTLCISGSDIIDASFYWFVTASYLNLIYPRGRGYYDHETHRSISLSEGIRGGGYIKNLFISLHQFAAPIPNKIITNLIIAKNSDAHVDASICLPPIETHTIKCKTPVAINILNGLVDRQIIKCLNSGDVDGAIHFINPTQCSSQESIIGILLEKYNRNLNNLNNMIDYVTNRMEYDSEQQREHEIERLTKKRLDFQDKIVSITKRIKECDMCCICLESPMKNKTVLKCCMNAYCFECISRHMTTKYTCPLCRERIDSKTFFVVRENNETQEETTSLATERNTAHIAFAHPKDDYDKIENLAAVINTINRTDPNNKILIFSTNESTLFEIQVVLTEMDRSYKMLKGTNMSIRNIVDRYKNHELNTLLVNPENYGSGLNLENTTDIIMLHRMDTEVVKQVLGRAQRYGRKTSLRVWNLLYENETSF